MIRRYKYRSLKKLQLHKNSVFLLEIRDTKQVTALLYYCITIVYSYDLLYFQRTEHNIISPPHCTQAQAQALTSRHGTAHQAHMMEHLPYPRTHQSHYTYTPMPAGLHLLSLMLDAWLSSRFSINTPPG